MSHHSVWEYKVIDNCTCQERKGALSWMLVQASWLWHVDFLWVWLQPLMSNSVPIKLNTISTKYTLVSGFSLRPISWHLLSTCSKCLSCCWSVSPWIMMSSAIMLVVSFMESKCRIHVILEKVLTLIESKGHFNETISVPWGVECSQKLGLWCP